VIPAALVTLFAGPFGALVEHTEQERDGAQRELVAGAADGGYGAGGVGTPPDRRRQGFRGRRVTTDDCIALRRQPATHYLIGTAPTLTVKRHGPPDTAGGHDHAGMGGYVLSSYIGSETPWVGQVEPMRPKRQARTAEVRRRARRSHPWTDAGGRQYDHHGARPETKFDEAVTLRCWRVVD
jgi:hypothetical protein